MTGKRIINFIKSPNALIFAFVLVTALGAAAPFFNFIATYLTRIGMSQKDISTVMALRPIAQIVGQFFWGIAADRSKSINRIMVYQMTGIIGSSIFMFFAKGFWPILISIMLYLFFYGALYPLIDTICMDMVNKGRLNSYGSIRTMTSLGYSISSWGSGFFAEANPSSIFIITAVCVTAALLLAFKLPTTQGQRIKGEKFNSLKFFMRPMVFIPLAGYLILEIVYSSLDSTFPVYLSIDLGAGESMYGLSMALRVMGELLILPFTRFIQKKLSFKNAFAIFMLASTVRFIICALTQNIYVLVFTSIIMGISTIGTFTWLVNYCGNLAPAHGKATVQSHMWMAFSIAQVLGSYTIRFFYPTVDSPVYFWVAAAIMTFGAVLVLFAKVDKIAAKF